jgi:peroxiredoxin
MVPMKTYRFSLVLLSLFSLLASAAGPKEGAPAPHFTATTLDGRAFDSESLRGKVVVLHFWATWCPPCREEMPALQKFYDEHHSEGLEIVAISNDDAGDEAKVREFANSYSYPMALMAGSKADGFGRIWVLPLTFVIDRKGILRKADWTGAEKINAASLNTVVLPLLNEK